MAAENDVHMSTEKADPPRPHHFIEEPLGKKLVSDVPGIGPVLRKELEAKEIDQACMLVGQFLWCKRDENEFKEWLKKQCPANKKQQNDCVAAIKGWCEQHAN